MDSSEAKKAFARLVAELQTLMIRHTKAQRIAGDAALKLPELDSETVWLTMTKSEQSSYAPKPPPHRIRSSVENTTVTSASSALPDTSATPPAGKVTV